MIFVGGFYYPLPRECLPIWVAAMGGSAFLQHADVQSWYGPVRRRFGFGGPRMSELLSGKLMSLGRRTGTVAFPWPTLLILWATPEAKQKSAPLPFQEDDAMAFFTQPNS
jgi:hypothetical protein